MSLTETLKKYVPEDAAEMCADLIALHHVRVHVKKDRKTKLGDYRPPGKKGYHQITLNQSLNKFAFLVTLLHELAHLNTFVKFQGKNIQPHGKEWKIEFSTLLARFIEASVFPFELRNVLINYAGNPKASSCTDLNLSNILRKYDDKQPGTLMVYELEENSVFTLPDGRAFKRGKKLRKRIRCNEITGNRDWFFHPHVVVFPADKLL